jgi:hypothetical protein
MAISAAVLTIGALLSTSSPATATEYCSVDTCDFWYTFYSDATYTVVVGEFTTEICGSVDWGERTQYFTRVWTRCS